MAAGVAGTSSCSAGGAAGSCVASQSTKCQFRHS